MQTRLVVLLALTALACEPDASDTASEPATEDSTPVDTDATSDSEQDTDAPTTSPEVPLSCGDGLLDDGEECDDGELNSDTVPDACRTDCTLASCGDSVIDTPEGCDDGDAWGGDGCDHQCQTESGTVEVEPNQHAFEATPWPRDTLAHGGLPLLDRDCWALDLEDNNFFSVSMAPDVNGECPWLATLTTYDPVGGQIATTLTTPGTCGGLTADEQPQQRYLDAGSYAVCIDGYGQSAVPGYALEATVGEDSCSETGWAPTLEQDLDGDGLANRCDDDDDGDGVIDTKDNCPLFPNGSEGQALSPAAGGWLVHWLLLGPMNNMPSPGGCEPSLDALADPAGLDDGDAWPILGTTAGAFAWTLILQTESAIDFLDHYGTTTPREAYAATWVRSDTPQEVVLSVGADDGVNAWVNDAQVLNIASCQGVVLDDFAATVTLNAGWNKLLFKVRDNGGGWGLAARILDMDGDPVEGLETSWGPQTWSDDQTDSDDDGIGDVCDDTPV